MSIRIIMTGGTFDKRYDEIAGQLTFNKSHLPQILQQARVTMPVTLEKTQLIDSLHMTNEDRQIILTACRNAEETKIIIIHGTDTMVETARLVGQAQLLKTIVFTGAMVPYPVFDSDALFNLGCSMGFVQLLAPSVYVAMNGRCFPWHNVHKNKSKGIFQINH